MSALILDAAGLLAVDRDDRSMIARLQVAQRSSLELLSNALVVAQVRRDKRGRQVNLQRLLQAVDRIMTSDPSDLTRLVQAAGNRGRYCVLILERAGKSGLKLDCAPGSRLGPG